jgi:23S rRNA-/tRNA-specific pseudouridylate synthase
MRSSEIQTRLRSWYGRWYFIRADFILGPKQFFINCDHLKSATNLAEQLLATARPDLPQKNLGAVYINGQLAKSNQQLAFPFKIEIYAKEEPLNMAAEPAIPCIIEDNPHFMLTFKPSRWPTLPLRDMPDFALSKHLEKITQQKLHFPSRLDTDTQGLVIAGKSKSVSQDLHQLFAEHLINKFYLARIEEQCGWDELECAAPIGQSLLSPAMRSVWGYNGATARTRFWRIATNHTGSLLLCQPITGRTHQIRVHLKYLGYKIVGDRLYGSATAADQELNLLAYCLSWPETKSRHLGKGRYLVPNNLFPEWLNDIPSFTLSRIPDFIETQLNIES